MQKIKKFAAAILKNLDLYGTVSVSIVVIVLGIAGVVSSTVISSATLAVLALLATALLRIRNTSEKKMTLGDVFKLRSQEQQLEQRLADAQSMDFCSMSNVSLGTILKEFLVEKVRQGCIVRVVSLNPCNKELMRAISPYASPSVDSTDHISQITTALNSLGKDPRLANSDRFQIRIYDYALPHALLITDGSTPKGKIRVEVYTSNRLPSQAPSLYVQKNEDYYWFNYFQGEFDGIWQKSKPYKDWASENTSKLS